MKVAIAGFGMEGRANYNYYATDPDNDVTIVDERRQIDDLPKGAKTLLGTGVFKRLNDFDLVIRTPGLSPYEIITNGTLWSGTEEFFAKCAAPIIGVTGTKGKGTTASMIASILEAAGRKVWLVGNIGLSALSVLPEIQSDDIVVYELSSFQLWNLKTSPSIAVILNIEPEHLDVHKSFEDYVNAKANIRRYQTAGEMCVYFAGSQTVIDIAHLSEAPSLPYGLDNPEGAHVKDGLFYVRDSVICSTTEIRLKGVHNLENAVAAVAATHCFGIDNDAIAAGLRNFTGLPHRLEFVARLNGADYYNDSFSSSTPATLAAVNAFTEPQIVILGGIDRGGDFEQLMRDLAGYTTIKEFVLIGTIRHMLADFLRAAHTSSTITVLDDVTMREIVQYVSKKAEDGDVVILSPGAASFDMFKDFYDRGDQFRSEVQAIAHRHDIFVFDSYEYDLATSTARFHYFFENDGNKGAVFTESVTFAPGENYDHAVLDNALRLAFLVAGVSYYKTHPVRQTRLPFTIDQRQADFLNHVYQEGLSQFAFENHLTREDMARFVETGASSFEPAASDSSGALVLQSGGKDSLLTASLLNRDGQDYTPLYIGSSDTHPQVLDDLGRLLIVAKRRIDLDSLSAEVRKGGRNGHVPVTYIVESYALIQAVLQKKKRILVSIAHEGEEPHAHIGNLSVTHQWSKTWEAEKLYAEFVHRYVSWDMIIGSPLRQYSELKVAELFVQDSWNVFGRRFSSCNRANYRQAADNTALRWCGNCPKCANSYLLFAPFVPAHELQSLFDGEDLFAKESLVQTFKGLLAIDGVMKPFECVGETAELRRAYHLALERGGYSTLPFEVPHSTFDYNISYPSQQIMI